MRILLSERIAQILLIALRKGGRHEVGGILMGEYVSEGVYRIRDITVQKQGGSRASFVRFPREATRSLQHFFRRTNCEYTRFNYLGEWHSHPGFGLEPSAIDHESMWEIVEDRIVGASFAVLLLARRNQAGLVQSSVSIYLPGRRWFKGCLIQEKETL